MIFLNYHVTTFHHTRMALVIKLWALYVLFSCQVHTVATNSDTNNNLHPPTSGTPSASGNSIPTLPKNFRTFHETGTKVGQTGKLESQRETTDFVNGPPQVKTDDGEGSDPLVDRIDDVGSSFQTRGGQEIYFQMPPVLTVDAQGKAGLRSVSDNNAPIQLPRGEEGSTANAHRIVLDANQTGDDDGDEGGDEDKNDAKDVNNQLPVIGEQVEQETSNIRKQVTGLDGRQGPEEYDRKMDGEHQPEVTNGGNGEAFPSFEKRRFDSISGKSAFASSFGKRRFDSIGNSAFSNFGKRRFDSIGNSAFSNFGKRRFDSIGNSAFSNFGKRRFDSIGNSAFSNFGKRRFDPIGDSSFSSFGKRRFDSIGNSAFSNFGKRRFDSIGNSAFANFGKRRFDSIGNSAFADFGKRRFDSIGNSAFSNFGKRRFDSIGNSAFANFGKRRFDSIGNSAFSNFGKRRFDSIADGQFAVFGKRDTNSDEPLAKAVSDSSKRSDLPLSSSEKHAEAEKRRFDSIAGVSSFGQFGKRDQNSNDLENYNDQTGNLHQESALSRKRRDAEVVEDVSDDKKPAMKKRDGHLDNVYYDADFGLKKRPFDSIDMRSGFRRFGRAPENDDFDNNLSSASKRRFDSIASKSNFGLFGKRGGKHLEDEEELMESLEKILNSKRRFDSIGSSSSFRSFGKRPSDAAHGNNDFHGSFGKRGFDRIGYSNFASFGKRRFDSISGASDFGTFGKRRFDSIAHHSPFTGFGKRRLDSIGGGQFASFGKRSDSKDSESNNLSADDVDIRGLLSLLKDLDPAELNSLGLVLDGNDIQFLPLPPGSKSLSNGNIAKRRFDSIDGRSAFRRFGRYTGGPSSTFSLVPDYNSKYPISETRGDSEKVLRLLSSLHRYAMALIQMTKERA